MTLDNPSERMLQYVDLGVGGMTCDDCVRTLTDSLTSVPGVVRAEVSLGQRTAHVAVDPSLDPNRLVEAVRQSGYNAFVRSGGIGT